jgi:hypothetical protein
MHKIHFILCGVIVLLLAGSFGYSTYKKSADADPRVSADTSTAQTQDSKESPYEEQVNEAGGVTVSVTPVSITDSGTWDFEVSLQTHSVPLDMDIATSIVLLDASGAEVSPESWEGDPAGGHHRAGTLRFSAITPIPEVLILRVKDIGGVSEREFTWEFSR